MITNSDEILMRYASPIDILEFRLPSDEEEEAAKILTTYAAYIRSLAHVAEDPELLNLATVAESPQYRAIQRKAGRENEIQQSLRQAWVEEASLRASRTHPYLALATCDAPRHAYYALFHGIRAILTAAGDGTSSQHAVTLREAGNWLLQRPALFVEPWTLLLSGNPNRSGICFEGRHADIEIRDVNALASWTEDVSHSLIAKFLKTTRRRQIADSVERKKEKLGVAKAPKGLYAQIASELPSTSVLQALFRLRKRNDYEDAMSLLLGAWNETQAGHLCDDLAAIVHSWLRQVEVLVWAYTGSEVFEFPLRQLRLHSEKNMPTARQSELAAILNE